MSKAAPAAQKAQTAAEAIIVLGTETPIGLAIIRDLGEHGYVTIGIGRKNTALSSYSRHCHHHVIRQESEADVVAQILDLAETYQAKCLLAISENDLLMLNKYRYELETKITLLIPMPDQLSQVLDKSTCQDHARASGITVPETWHFSSLSEARKEAPDLSYPVVLKWSDPNSVMAQLDAIGLQPLKAEYAHDAEDLLVRLGRFDKAGVFPMVQSYCPGHGLGQMFLVKGGDVVMEFQHERLHEWPPEGGVSSLCRSVPLSEHGDARARSRALLRRLRWTGVAMVEYRYDPETQQYHFMEINGRFWGSLPLALAAGVPFASALVAHCGATRRHFSFPKQYSAVTACYWIPETKRLLRLLLSPSEIQDPFYKSDLIRSAFSYLSLPFRPSTRWFIFRFSDPMPFFGDLASIFVKLRDMGWGHLRALVGLRTQSARGPNQT